VIGLSRPGTSPLHRAPPGLKLLLLAAGALVLVALRSPVAVGVACLVVLVGYLLAGLGPREPVHQVWPLRWVVLLLVPFQWWTDGWQAAVVVVGTLLALVAAAGLVTLTTRMTALLDLLERLLRPLRRFGLQPERVSLLLALTIRAVPVLVDTLSDVRDARRARGLERSPKALLVPVLLRTMRHADRLGEALVARGVDD
jgi:biotin transport system permease protein